MLLLCKSVHLPRLAELDPETASVYSIGDHPYFPAHFLDCFPDDGKPDAGPFYILVRVNSFKRTKKPVLNVWINANSIVRKPEADELLLGLGTNIDMGGHRGSPKLHSVVQEVSYRLSEGQLMPEHPM